MSAEVVEIDHRIKQIEIQIQKYRESLTDYEKTLFKMRVFFLVDLLVVDPIIGLSAISCVTALLMAYVLPSFLVVLLIGTTSVAGLLVYIIHIRLFDFYSNGEILYKSSIDDERLSDTEHFCQAIDKLSKKVEEIEDALAKCEREREELLGNDKDTEPTVAVDQGSTYHSTALSP